jgi:hypothetical protein
LWLGAPRRWLVAEHTIVLRLADHPEALHALRREVCRVLREAADAEANPAIARRLREIADDFEAGLRVDADG